MLKTFEEITKNVNLKKKIVQIDNTIFKLHYVFTFGVLLICTILVSSRQYVGEHIRCIADVVSKNDNSNRVIETFCFFTSTYTVVHHLAGGGGGGMAAHPGVGPHRGDEPVIRHAYYQWVPFALFGQALMFYLPHLMWKKLEGGRIKSMASGFEYAALAFKDADKGVKVGEVTVPTVKERRVRIDRVRGAVLDRLRDSRSWVVGLVFCELLNVGNILVQVWAMNEFLGGKFMSVGQLVLGWTHEDLTNPMDVVFPKVTKCNFHKYGSSGSIQRYDALCVMALNVINEKIYAFLWFWFLALLALTTLGLLYRLVSIVFYSRSMAFNRFSYWYCCPVTLDPEHMRVITKESDYSDWVFLHYLALSMDGLVFRDLFDTLADEIRRRNRFVRTTNCFDEDLDEENGKKFSVVLPVTTRA